MNYHILSYIVYLGITISVTVWVATTLFKNGKVFLLDIFDQNKLIAQSVNQLLLVGFYLVNLGYVIISLKIIGEIDNLQMLIEKLSFKVGFIILILGGMHFFNLFIFFRLRNKSIQRKANTTTEKILVKKIPYGK